MKNYLAVILRSEFNLYYRFGYTFIPSKSLFNFKDLSSDKLKRQILEHFKCRTPFEYDEEYLILQLEKEKITKEFTRFRIAELVKVFPLSLQAKASIETKIDSRIKLEEPIFEELLPPIEAVIAGNEVSSAIESLWHICNIEGTQDKIQSKIGIGNILNGLEQRRKGIKPVQYESGNYWEYVIMYDRFEYFPNTTLGYFYDAGQIFANSQGRNTFEGSQYHKLLESISRKKPNIKFNEIVKLIESAEQSKKYIDKTNVEGVLQYFVTPLYLMLKNEIRGNEELSNTSLIKHADYLKEFGENYQYAIVLLGSFFGFKKFYDLYYDNLNLQFFKDSQVVKTVEKDLNNEKEIKKLSKPTKHEQVDMFKEKEVASSSVEEKDLAKTESEKTTKKKSKKVKVVDSSENGPSEGYAEIILEEVIKTNGKPVKLSEIKKALKSKTKQSLNHTVIKKVITTIDNVEFSTKKPETAWLVSD